MTWLTAITRWLTFKEWNNLSGPQQWSVGFTAFSALSSVVIVIVFGGVSQVTYIYLVISATATLLMDRITRYIFENNMARDVSKIIDSQSDLHYIGDTSDGLRWVSANLEGVRAVDNTVWRPRSGEWNRTTSQYDGYVDAIRKAIENGCGWRDLALNDSVSDVSAFLDKLGPQQKDRYEARHIVSNIPLFQMTILKYKDYAKSSVCFGWAFPGSDGSRVFVSTDPKIVRYFEDYYRELYAKAEPIHGIGAPHPERPQSRQTLSAPEHGHS